jgi:hypothetical protein
MLIQRSVVIVSGTLFSVLILGIAGGCKSTPISLPFRSQPVAVDDHSGHDADLEATAFQSTGLISQTGVSSVQGLPSNPGLAQSDEMAIAAQGICPVSGEPLGSMGSPIKVNLQGRDVFVCCAGCVSKLQEDPQKYLANLST